MKKKIKIIEVPDFVEKLIAVVCFLFVAIGSFADGFSISEMTANIFIGVGFAGLLIYQSRVWWFPYYVEWNKKQIYIKITGGQKGFKLKFTEIQSVVLQKKDWILKLRNGETIEIPIEHLDRNDLQVLQMITMENIIDKL